MPGALAPDEKVPIEIWIGFIAMMFGNFMALLDVQIVASAIGQIQAGVGASRDEISWVQTGYLIAEVIGIPLSGFLARALGTRLLFTVASLSFGAASLACALAWDIESLIVFRCIQGFVGAAMVPTTMATLYVVFPQSAQPMAGAMVGLVSTLAPSIGPSLGGYIAENVGWRWLFLINIVPSILIAVLVWRYMKIGKFDLAFLKKIDFIGLIGLAVFLGSLEYVLEEGTGEGWFGSIEIWQWTIISAAGAFIFFWRALTREAPIVDLRPFTVPTFAIGAALGFTVGLAIFGPIFLQPLFLGEIRGMNAEQIGHTMWAQGVTMMIAAPIVGRYSRMLPDLRPFGFAGFIIIAISCFMQSNMTAQTGFYEFVIPQILRGIGMMMTFMSIMQPAMQSLPPHLMQSGTGLFNLCRNLGGALGLAVLSSVQAKMYFQHRSELYANATTGDYHAYTMIERQRAWLESTGAQDPDRQAVMNYARILDREALVMAFNDQFFYMGFILLIGAGFMWFMRRAPAAPTPEAARAMQEAH